MRQPALCLWALAALTVAGLTACSPAPSPPTLHPSIARVHGSGVDAMTRLVAQREWLALQQVGKLPAHVQTCVGRIAPDELAAPIAPVLQARFGANDRAAANAFLDSPAGQHLATALLNTLHGDSEAMARLQQQSSTSELHAQVQFTQTALGLLLVGGLDPRTRSAIQQALTPLLQSCQEPALA